MQKLLTGVAIVMLMACKTTEPPRYAAGTSVVSQDSSVSPFAIKDYVLGASMPSCPRETITQDQKGELTLCILGPSTYANAPVTNTSLMLSGGELIAVMVNFKHSGQYANSDVLNALVQRYGQPSSMKKHINEAVWIRRNAMLRFDGWKGTLALMNKDKFDAANGKNAVSNQKDM